MTGRDYTSEQREYEEYARQAREYAASQDWPQEERDRWTMAACESWWNNNEARNS